MSENKLLGTYCGKQVYENDENSTEFKLMVLEGKRMAASINTTEPNKKIHAAECVKSGLEYVDCEELKIKAALAVVLVGWLGLFYYLFSL